MQEERTKSGKIANHFPHFHLFPALKGRFLCIPPTPFYYNFHPCHPYSQSHLPLEKVKRTGVDITRFFSNAKCYANFSPTKHKKCLLEAPYGSSQTSKLELFPKKVKDL